MVDQTFRPFLDRFLESWRNSSLIEMERFISRGYQGREFAGGEGNDFGYEESMNGWKQGFEFVKGKGAKWDVKEMSLIPLREDEILVVISATILIHGETMETCNLFFDTFKKLDDEWKLVRSYIEAGVPVGNVHTFQFDR